MFHCASVEETDEVFCAWKAVLRKSPAAQMKLVDTCEAFVQLDHARATQRLVIAGDYAVMFDVGKEWYMPPHARVLYEQFAIRFQKVHGDTPATVPEVLDELARRFRCVAIAAGDTQVGAMTPHYLAAGFKPLGSQFFKEIPNGVAP